MLVLSLVFFAGTFGLNFQITSALMATEVFGKGPRSSACSAPSWPSARSPAPCSPPAAAQVRHRLVVGAALAFGATVLLAGLMPSYLTFALLAPVTGLTALTFITSANTYMQLHTDAGVRGRVMSLYLMIFMGGTPIGAPVIGWIGQEYGARWTLLGGGLLTIAGVGLSAMLYLRLERARRERGPDAAERPTNPS